MGTVACERTAPPLATYHAVACQEVLAGGRGTAGGNSSSMQMKRGAPEAHSIASSSRVLLWPHRMRSFAKRNRFFLIKYGLYTGLSVGYWLTTRPHRTEVPSTSAPSTPSSP